MQTYKKKRLYTLRGVATEWYGICFQEYFNVLFSWIKSADIVKKFIDFLSHKSSLGISAKGNKKDVGISQTSSSML